MIIDIRDIGEFRNRPTKAENIPLRVLKRDWEFLRNVEDIVIICNSGTQSRKMVHYLEQRGIYSKADLIKKYI